MDSILYFLAIIAVSIVSGLWIMVVLPKSQVDNKLAFSFVFGIITLTLVSAWCSFLGFTTIQSAYIVFFVLVIINVFLIVVRRVRIIGGLSQILPQSVPLILSTLSGCVILIPIILFNGFNAISDSFTYYSIADYLMENSYFEKANPDPFSPWETQMKLYQSMGYRMGAQFLLAYFTVLFDAKFSLVFYMPVLALGHMFFVVSTWLFTKSVFNFSNKVAALSSIFVGFHFSLYIQNAMNSFFPQTYGMGLFLLVLMLYKLLVDGIKQHKLLITTLFSAASAALVLTYSELIPFVLLSCGFYSLIKYKDILKKNYLYIAASLILISVFSNVALINAVKALKTQLNAIVGWNITFTLWEYILVVLGLYPSGQHGRVILDTHSLLNLAISLVVILILFIVLKYWLFSDQIQREHMIVLAFTLPFILMVLYFSIFVNNPWIPNVKGHTWSVYKAVQYGATLISPIIAYSVYCFMKRTRLNQLIGYFLVTGYVVLSISFSYQYAHASTEHMRVFTGVREPLEEYTRLKDKLSIVEQPINILIPTSSDVHSVHRKMIAYFLKDNEIISDWSTDIYVYPYLSNTNPAFKDDGIYLIYDPGAKDKVANMRIIESDDFYIGLVEGPYSKEQNESKTWYWTDHSLNLASINTHTDQVEVKLDFTLGLPPNVDSEKRVELWINNGKEMELTISPSPTGTHFEFPVRIDQGMNTLSFKFLGDSVKYETDPRDLAFSLIDFNYNLIHN